MGLLVDSFITALKLIASGDREVFSITLRTLAIACSSTVLSAIVFIPIGSFIDFHSFPGKNALVNVIQTLYSMPTVFIGMLVFMAFSRAGPLGFTGILFSPQAIVVGQTLLISPIIAGVTISALSAVGQDVRETALSLGANTSQAIITMLREARYGITTAVLLGFGRAISEVGVAIMVGGNIRGHTRTLTTAMALETSIGNLELSMALGIILIFFALTINILVRRFQPK